MRMHPNRFPSIVLGGSALLIGLLVASVIHSARAQTRPGRGQRGPAGSPLPGHVQDAASATAPILDMDHFGSGSATSYGINIFNRADNNSAPTAGAGANSAFVIHNYSDFGPAMQIDSTRSKPFVTFKNASNAVNSAGTQGTSPYFDFWGYTTGSPTTNLLIGELNQFLGFISYDVSRPWTFQSNTTATSLQVNQPNAGVGLTVTEDGAGNAVSVMQNGANHGVVINATVGADGFFPLLITGRTNAAGFTTSQSGVGQNVLQVTKNGTGAGDAEVVINKGTGKTYRMQNAAGDTSSFGPNGELIIGAGGTQISKSLRATISWTPLSVASGACTSNTITVTGAVAGADVVATPPANSSLLSFGAVATGNTCNISWCNPSAAGVVPPSGTYACRVFNP